MNPETATHEAAMITSMPPVDRTGWGSGSWDTEPDRAEWYHLDIPCLALRNPRFGFWCGYAAVPPGHPLHGVHFMEVPVDVHGGVNYSDRCDGARICHVPRPGEPDDVWWFGFDCGHALDVAPAMEARMRELERLLPSTDPIRRMAVEAEALMLDNRHWQPVYRTLAFVQVETMDLARQLKEIHDASGR